MAYNSIRERDPLIDKETQRALERRLTEFLGIALITCAVLFSLLISTILQLIRAHFLHRMRLYKMCLVKLGQQSHLL